MFNQPVDNRLTAWADHRRQLEEAENPLQEAWDFWHHAPFTPHNRNIDPYYQSSWPSPWEIIADNKYDDFTKALMIGWTLKLTKKYQHSKIELKSVVDANQIRQYNLLYIDDDWVVNYSDNGPIPAAEVPASFRLENLIEVSAPR